MYVCISCGKEVDIDLKTAKWVRCPYCGYRIFRKKRARVTKKVPAE